MDIYEKLIKKDTFLAVVGLGYVGLPIAHEYAKKLRVIGFDINQSKIESYKQGIDITKEIGNEELKNTGILFTSDETRIRDAKFIIVAVPTPINDDRTPDLKPVIGASEIAGRNLTKGS